MATAGRVEHEDVYLFSWEGKEREGDMLRDVKPEQLASTKATTRNKPGQLQWWTGSQETAANRNFATVEAGSPRVRDVGGGQWDSAN